LPALGLVATVVALIAASPAAAGVLTVQKSSPVGSSIGTVSSDPAGISCGGDCIEDYPSEEVCTPNPHVPSGEVCNTVDQSVELTAAGQNGFAIQSWTGCDSVSSNKCTVVMSGDKTVTANYADAQDPVAELTSPAAGSAKRGSVTIAANASDNWGVTKVDFTVDGIPIGSDTGAPYEISFDSTTKADGTHTVGARATDFAGRISAASTRSITIDNTAPEITVGGPDEQTFGPGSTQTWTLSTSDETSGVASLQCSVGPSGDPPVFGPCSGPASHSVTGLGGGKYAFSARVTDGAGNTFERWRQFSIDATPPDTTITAGPEEGSSTDSPTAMFNYDSSEIESSFSCRLYPSGSAPPAFESCGWKSHGPFVFTAGTWVFEVFAIDQFGNADQSPARRTFTVLAPPTSNDGSSGGSPGGGGVPDRGQPPLSKILSPSVARRWKLSGEMTAVEKLVVKKLARGARVDVRCKGEGCPFRSRRLSAKGSSVTLTKLFDSELAPGSSIELRITQAGFVGKLYRFVTRPGKAPKTTVRCLPPGSSKPVAC
jgi:Bacterial Ig domain/Divergent InlB B-repeat domain